MLYSNASAKICKGTTVQGRLRLQKETKTGEDFIRVLLVSILKYCAGPS